MSKTCKFVFFAAFSVWFVMDLVVPMFKIAFKLGERQ